VRRFFLALILVTTAAASGAQAPGRARVFSHADTLRGSNGPARAWWHVEFYDLHVTVSPTDSTIRGWNGIAYRALKAGRELQVDLQVPMSLDSVTQGGKKLTFRRDSNAFFVALGAPAAAGSRGKIVAHYHGKPRIARNPPWDGGLIWRRDSLGTQFISTANEGLGASVWWPTKDYSGDEPDSVRVAITVPDSLENISNGRLRSVTRGPGGTTWEWFASSPMTIYGVSINAGRYAHFTDYFQGEKGVLTMDYYPLAIHEASARTQFKQAVTMMSCFEHWFGPYPWYEDGYKLVEAPYLGMEHQTAVTYGNRYGNGYLGRDLSGTGHGLKWDYIIVHESAHEWWANNVSMDDAADMWIHESFAYYAEGLYTECTENKQAGIEYLVGSRRNIRNDGPILGTRGVNSGGSGDVYPKGANMLMTMRAVLDNDEKWRSVLRGAQATFARQTIPGTKLQAYINAQTGIDYTKVFEQYLGTTKVPALEYKVDGGAMQVRWNNVVPGFAMPVEVAASSAPDVFRRIKPTTEWTSAPAVLGAGDSLVVRKDFYVEVKRQ